jgi:hypothetical protein
MIDKARMANSGNRRSDEQDRAPGGKFSAKDRSVNNVDRTATRPRGNAIDAGLRRLRKESDGGNTRAASLYQRVLDAQRRRDLKFVVSRMG